ncbi:hypothetical protein MIZ03_4383 [Rhodoferax lithotrophicus]|uniref:Uncharacterized protein n=1 Tax=Rhodoferax lithotrophicus TaxID=2798804 RepID=A0ABM7MST8_9BURK|nr:hypothetical protein MIZ03_2191 [Rhodoferax sp. MIZ03]BCO29460.1 hypothetical protein MIZ03_4383 [Rhodoferax sp. MIZ03]
MGSMKPKSTGQEMGLNGVDNHRNGLPGLIFRFLRRLPLANAIFGSSRCRHVPA